MTWMVRVLCVLLICHVASAALDGTYTVGSGRDFLTLQDAVEALTTEGISGEVKFSIDPGQYTGPLLIGAFSGSGAFAVLFVPSSPGTIELVSSDPGAPVLTISGAAALLFQSFELAATGAAQPALRVESGAQDVSLAQCSFHGQGAGRAVEVLGSATSRVWLTGCLIRGAGDGVVFSSTTSSATGSGLDGCVIDSIARGVVIERQNNFSVLRCEIKPNSGALSGATAVHVGPQNAADSVFVTGNRMSAIRTSSSYAVAVRHAPQVNSARLICANNFIYGFENTGSSQVRALNLSGGDNRVVNNSILVNDVTATGTAYTIYDGLTAPDARLTLVNNILVNLEATRPAYNLFVLTSAGVLESDHNLFHGTGTTYRLGWLLSEYATLSAWQATGQDGHSYSGDPLFISATDLHLQTTSSLAHQNGAVAQDVSTDVDGAPRFQPPDIGADEYQFAAPATDAALLNVLDLPSAAPEGLPITIHLVIQNRGSQPLNNAPVRVIYRSAIQAQQTITLAPSVTDTVELSWQAGGPNSASSLIASVIALGDANPSNNFYLTTLQITATPLSGVYSVGGASSPYATLGAALADLALRGLGGPVTLDVTPGLYDEALQITAYSGLSAQNPLTIRRASDEPGAAQLTSSLDGSVIRLTGASHVTLDDLTLQGSSSALELLRIETGSSWNTVRNCTLLGASESLVASAAVIVSGAECHGNLIESCAMSDSYYGVRLDGTSVAPDSGNVVRACRIDSVRTAVHAAFQRNLLISQCEISAGYAGAPGPCYGVQVAAQSAGDTVTISGNRLLGGSSSGALFGVACDAGNGVTQVVNNWIGNFDSTANGTVTAIGCWSGECLIWHNSVDIGDLESPGSAVALSLRAASANVSLANNAFRIRRSNGGAEMVEWLAGELSSDYNLFETPGANPEFRFAHSALDDDLQTLSAWTDATAQDHNSVAAPAGYFSDTDFHIRPDASGPSARGLYLPAVNSDLDGEPRDSLPDLGADEYEFIPAIVDLGVEQLELSDFPVQSGATTTVTAILRNSGQLGATDARVTLAYQGVPLDSQIVSLAPAEVRELTWQWQAPVTELEFGGLRVELDAAGDAVPTNNFGEHVVVVTGSALSGDVAVGPGQDFATPSELAAHLKWRGVSSGLTATLAPGTYVEPVVFEAIPGASSAQQVLLRGASPEATTLSCGQSAAVVEFRGCQYVSLEQLSVVTDAETPVAVLFNSQSCFNRLSECLLSGPGSGELDGAAIKIQGSGCVANRIESCAISSAYHGVALTGDDFDPSRDNVISGCVISDAVHGVWLDHQVGAQVVGNEIIPGSWSGPAASCYGVYIVQLGSAGSARIEGNRIHGFLDTPGPRSNRATGVYSAEGVDASVEIVNNFIYGFGNLATLRVRAIYLSSGNQLVAYNSIRLDNVPANNDVAGIFVSTGMEHELFNNCVLSYEGDVPVFGVDVQSGAGVVSDHNCLWGNDPAFSVGRNGATTYATLASWQQAGYDFGGISARPAYVSSSDLHLLPEDTVCAGRGLALPEVTTDIDGEARDSAPSIGADEAPVLAQLPAPTGLRLICVTGTELLFRWEPVPGATLYRVYGALLSETLSETATEVAVTELPEVTFEIDQFSPNQFFYFVVAE